MSEPDDLVARQLELFNWLRLSRHVEYDRSIRAFLAGADFETTFRVISAAFGDRDLDVLLGVARERHGPWAELISPAIENAVRLQQNNDYREQFETDEDRMVASILMCSHSRQDVFRLLDESLMTTIGAWHSSAWLPLGNLSAIGETRSFAP